MRCKYLINKKCSVCSDISGDRFYPSNGFCLKFCEPHHPRIDKLKEVISKIKARSENLITPEQKEKREKQQKELAAAIATLPPLTHRIVALDNWMKDIGVPFQQKTGLLFTSKDHKLQRDDICRQCPHMAKEGDTMSCTKCGCRMGKLVADESEPNPHEIMGKLGAKGKTADAIRIKSASWYMVKKCGNWQEDDRWKDLDARHMTEEQLGVRDELYTKNT